MKKIVFILLLILTAGAALTYRLIERPHAPAIAANHPGLGAPALTAVRTSTARLPVGTAAAALPAVDAKLVQSVIAAGDRPFAWVLIDALVRSDDPKIARDCRTALARMADGALIQDIARRHKLEQSGQAKGRLSNLLARVENGQATEALAGLARIPDHPLAHSATEGLSWIGNGPAASELIRLYEKSASRERTRLFGLITQLDRAEARPVIESAARGNKEAVSEDTRAAAIRALGNFPDSRTRDLLDVLRNDPNAIIRVAAAGSLDRIGGPASKE